MELNYTPNKIWKPFYVGDWDIAVLIGGRGSGKTWNAGNFCVLNTFANFGSRSLILRDVASSINQSILQNIKGRFIDIDEQSGNIYRNSYEIQENQIKNYKKETIIITKGFRTSRVEQQTDLKGFEDIDLAIIEEAEDIRDEERVNTLLDTLRKKGNKVILILNTPDLEHWIIKRFFDFEKTKTDGYFKLIPKKIPRICQVVTSYLDNDFLPERTKDKYSSYNDVNSYNYNPDYFSRSILGLATENQNILRKFDLNKIKTITPKKQFETIEGVKWYKSPTAGKFYSIGVDTSGGKEDSDYTGISVREMSENYPVICQFKQRVNPDLTSPIILDIFKKLILAGGFPLIIVEAVENTGGTVNQALRTFINDDQYFYQRFDTDPNRLYGQSRGDVGFKSTSSSRNKIIANFSTLFNSGNLDIVNEDEIKEMMTFVWNEKKSKYEHMQGEHDDLLFADMICLEGFEYIMKHKS